MRSQVPVRPLRERDALTVEIEVQALAQKPLGQLAPQNVADLCALDEVAEIPHALRVRLKGFRDRMARAFGDILNGDPLNEEIEAFSRVPAEEVPYSLRSAWAEQVENPKRTEADKAAVRDLVDGWNAVDPKPFEMAPPRKAAQVPGRAPAEPGRTKTPRAAATPPVHRPVPVVDAARQSWIASIVVDRLFGTEGLLEEVLLTTIRHRARERYPDLQAHEIKSVLRDLEGRNRIRSSAGRWRSR